MGLATKGGCSIRYCESIDTRETANVILVSRMAAKRYGTRRAPTWQRPSDLLGPTSFETPYRRCKLVDLVEKFDERAHGYLRRIVCVGGRWSGDLSTVTYDHSVTYSEDPECYQAKLRSKLRPEAIRSTLAFAGLFQITHEMIKQAVLVEVREFYSRGFDENETTYDEVS